MMESRIKMIARISNAYEECYKRACVYKNYPALDIMNGENDIEYTLHQIDKDVTKLFEVAFWDLEKNESVIGDKIKRICEVLRNETSVEERSIEALNFIGTRNFVSIWGCFNGVDVVLSTDLTLDECGDDVWATRIEIFE